MEKIIVFLTILIAHAFLANAEYDNGYRSYGSSTAASAYSSPSTLTFLKQTGNNVVGFAKGFVSYSNTIFIALFNYSDHYINF